MTALTLISPALFTSAERIHTQAIVPLVAVQNGRFALAGRPLPYLHGINYEGPSDRPWRMWQDNLFSPTLIARDFDAIAAAGYSPVRIFIQRPLPTMILNGDFSRLDSVIDLAATRGLRLLITFNDDGDPDLTRVARVERLIAAHLAGNPTIFGYDLRNEPNLVDIAASIYPAGAPLPLLSGALIDGYHERDSMAVARKAWRSGAWAGGGFAAFDAKKLYYYLNARDILNAFMSANPSYPAVPAAPYWTRFLDLASRTLGSYLFVQLAALRAADPAHLITVGYNSRFWSALPANAALGFRSIHLYPPADFEGFHATLRRFEALNALASSPLVLEEYGVSNDRNGRQVSAVREMAAALYLRTLGGAGDMKWMFNDDAVGYNAYENNLGAVDARNQPKPTYLASAAANAYWAHTPNPAGLILQPDPATGAGFVYLARDGLAIGGSLPYADGRVSYAPRGPGVLWLDWSTPGLLRITPTNSGTLNVTLGTLTGATALVSSPPLTPTLPTLTPTLPTTAPTAVTSVQPSATPTATQSLSNTIPPTSTAQSTITGASAASCSSRAAVQSGSAGVSPACRLGARASRPHAMRSQALALSQLASSATATTTLTAPAAAPPISSGIAVTATGALTVTLHVQAGVAQTVAYRATGLSPAVPIDLPAPALANAWYIVARGHNIAPPFLKPWLTLGADTVIGLPVTEAFAYNGLPTQYFDTVALRIGPHGLTTAPIGAVALNGARPRVPQLSKRITHYYDQATGHNIHGFFLDFWRRHGAARFWGDPLSEEMREDGRLVQYFSGAEFVLTHTKGGRVDVTLMPLGRRMWPRIRHVYGL